jgi:hypothetical protein
MEAEGWRRDERGARIELLVRIVRAWGAAVLRPYEFGVAVRAKRDFSLRGLQLEMTWLMSGEVTDRDGCCNQC